MSVRPTPDLAHGATRGEISRFGSLDNFAARHEGRLGRLIIIGGEIIRRPGSVVDVHNFVA